MSKKFRFSAGVKSGRLGSASFSTVGLSKGAFVDPIIAGGSSGVGVCSISTDGLSERRGGGLFGASIGSSSSDFLAISTDGLSERNAFGSGVVILASCTGTVDVFSASSSSQCFC